MSRKLRSRAVRKVASRTKAPPNTSRTGQWTISMYRYGRHLHVSDCKKDGNARSEFFSPTVPTYGIQRLGRGCLRGNSCPFGSVTDRSYRARETAPAHGSKLGYRGVQVKQSVRDVLPFTISFFARSRIFTRDPTRV